jgi:hypothetical protein
MTRSVSARFTVVARSYVTLEPNMQIIFDYVNELMEIDASTMSLLLFICGVAKWMIKNHLTNAAMVFIMYPFTMLFSMGAYLTFYRLELFALNKPDQWLMWTIMAATVGVLVTLVATAGFMKISQFFKDRAHKQMLSVRPIA